MKSRTVGAQYAKCEEFESAVPNRIANPNPAKQQHDYIAEPITVCGGGNPLSEKELNYLVAEDTGKYVGRQAFMARPGQDDKSKALLANASKGVPYNVCAEPIPINTTGGGKSQTVKAQAEKTSTANIVCYKSTYGASGVAEPVRVGTMPMENGDVSQSIQWRIYSTDGKAVTQKANGGGGGAKTGLYAIRVADGKQYPVYEVKDGKIEVRGKLYPINLTDGFYVIRKLSVSECKRLQTVPDWYDMTSISNSQSYKCLGNGWTISVIKHLINCCLNGQLEERQESLW